MHVSGGCTDFQFMQYISFLESEGGKYTLALTRVCTYVGAPAAQQEKLQEQVTLGLGCVV